MYVVHTSLHAFRYTFTTKISNIEANTCIWMHVRVCTYGYNKNVHLCVTLCAEKYLMSEHQQTTYVSTFVCLYRDVYVCVCICIQCKYVFLYITH